MLREGSRGRGGQRGRILHRAPHLGNANLCRQGQDDPRIGQGDGAATPLFLNTLGYRSSGARGGYDYRSDSFAPNLIGRNSKGSVVCEPTALHSTRSDVKKALLLTLAALTAIPVLATASTAEARGPGWRTPSYRPGPAMRYRPYRPYGPVYRPRYGPVFIPIRVMPPPVIVYEPAPRRVVVVREEPEVIVHEAPPTVAYAPVEPVETVSAPPAASPYARDFLGVGVHLMGATVEGQKLGLSSAENPGMAGVGVTLRGRFSDSLGLELSADFLSGSGDSGDLTQSTIPLMAGITWHPMPTSRLQPYLIAGVGVHFTRLEYFGGDYNIDLTELAGQLGGGLEFFLTENIALSADLRAMTVFKNLDTKEKIATDCVRSVGTQSGFCDNIHFTGAEDKVDLGFQFKAGVSYYF